MLRFPDGITSAYISNVLPHATKGYVLVVEDDPALRELYKAALRAAGLAVVSVEGIALNHASHRKDRHFHGENQPMTCGHLSFS